MNHRPPVFEVTAGDSPIYGPYIKVTDVDETVPLIYRNETLVIRGAQVQALRDHFQKEATK